MRGENGLSVIENACEKLGRHTDRHLDTYGKGFERRLTGDHETCSYKEFRWGIADRTASVRIPREVVTEGSGYLEDRRPNANCDPYLATHALLRTICGV